jgi:hypothetical protein
MKKDIKNIRTLLLYQVHSADTENWYLSYIQRLNAYGFDVEGFCITYQPEKLTGWLPYQEIDKLYKKGDRRLNNLYKSLIKRAKEKDVLFLFNGGNLHVDILPKLMTFNVYMCFDDPESSFYLSEPVAKYFDASFVGNIACINLYKSWGCKNIFYRPHGSYSYRYSENITENEILNRNNTIDVCLFCERETEWRREKLDYLTAQIPTLFARGKGWPGGYVSYTEMMLAYSKSKIGINLHNSVGPVNTRTFALPANGIMQICDNKYFLGHIFELGKEVIGFTDILEVPEIVDYYLEHEDERKQIALNGWKRAVKEYNEIAVWEKQMIQIAGLL